MGRKGSHEFPEESSGRRRCRRQPPGRPAGHAAVAAARAAPAFQRDPLPGLRARWVPAALQKHFQAGGWQRRQEARESREGRGGERRGCSCSFLRVSGGAPGACRSGALRRRRGQGSDPAQLSRVGMGCGSGRRAGALAPAALLGDRQACAPCYYTMPVLHWKTRGSPGPKGRPLQAPRRTLPRRVRPSPRSCLCALASASPAGLVILHRAPRLLTDVDEFSCELRFPPPPPGKPA